MEYTTVYFKRIKITYGSTEYFFTEEELAELAKTNYWHGDGDPSSWLCEATFSKAQIKCKDAHAPIVMELAAKTLGITEEILQNALDWYRHYMDFHG